MTDLVDRCNQAIEGGRQNPELWQEACLKARRSLPPNLAIKVIRAASDDQPDSPALGVGFAEACLRLGWIDEAESTLQRILVKRPKLKRALAAHAKAAVRGDRTEAALARWLKYLTHHPDDCAALRQLAECYGELGRQGEAIDTYEKIVRLGEDVPLDHYAVAELRANLAGGWLTLSQSQALTVRFADDPDVASKHVNRLRLAGRQASAREVERRHEGRVETGSGTLSAARLTATRLMETRRYQAAAEAYLQAFLDHPNELRPVVRAAECYGLAGMHEQAAALLARVGNDEPHDLLTRAVASDHQAQGNLEAAVASQVKAVRLCGDLANLSKLCTLLLQAGHVNLTAQIIDRMEAAFGKTRSGILELARLRLASKDTAKALFWMERAFSVLEDPRRVLFDFADVLWATGEVERAWYLLIGHVTDRPAFYSSSPIVRAREFETLQDLLRRTKAQLDNTEDEEGFLAAVLSLKQSASVAYMLKTNGYLDREAGAFLSELTALEASGDLTAAAALIDRSIDPVVARTALPERVGDLLFRAARVNERLGRVGAALAFLERAIWMNKTDKVLLSYYRRMLRRHTQAMRFDESQPTAVLILTWKGNLEKARFLASRMKERADLAVITLWGNPELEAPAIKETAYGHELIVPCDDGYLGLARKLTLAYRYLYCRTNLAGVFKIDDDAALSDVEKFAGMNSGFLTSGKDYIGYIARYTNGMYHHGRGADDAPSARRAEHPPIDYCMGGLGYFLSRRSMKAIFELGLTYYSSENPLKVYEDVFFGEILKSAGIVPTGMNVAEEGGLIVEIFEPFMLLAPDILGDETPS